MTSPKPSFIGTNVSNAVPAMAPEDLHECASHDKAALLANGSMNLTEAERNFITQSVSAIMRAGN